jgi:hypothetical protein
MRQFLAFLFALGTASVCTAQPVSAHIAAGPAESAQRAFDNLDSVAHEPWINGDWGMKATIFSGKGKAAVAANIEMLGGWVRDEGRWQRLHTPNGNQFLICGDKIWKLTELGAVELADKAKTAPMIEQLPLNWELYTMDFLSWTARRYIGVVRLRGRWCDKVELEAPEASESFARALVWSDAEFGVPMQAQLYTSDGRLAREVEAVSLKKIGPQWVLRKWDCRDSLSKAKVSIEIEAVALGGQWPAELRAPNAPYTDWPELTPESWTSLE